MRVSWSQHSSEITAVIVLSIAITSKQYLTGEKSKYLNRKINISLKTIHHLISILLQITWHAKIVPALIHSPVWSKWIEHPCYRNSIFMKIDDVNHGDTVVVNNTVAGFSWQKVAYSLATCSDGNIAMMEVGGQIFHIIFIVCTLQFRFLKNIPK